MENSDVNNALREYLSNYDKYKKLCANIAQCLREFLDDQNIGCVSIYHRVKKAESFLSKIERKRYENPIRQMPDISGVRIICFFQSDIDNISNIIEKEFDILESSLGKNSNPKEFGYRSKHYVLRLKKSWLKIPNYKGLEGLVCEVQLRTILMHAWAEIEHKLAYKKVEHIPEQFRRKFSLISAKLEEVDQQFEELAEEIKEYRKDIGRRLRVGRGMDNPKLLIDLDSLQAFLDHSFPLAKKDLQNTILLLDEFIKDKKAFNDLIEEKNRKEGLPTFDPRNQIKQSQESLMREMIDK